MNENNNAKRRSEEGGKQNTKNASQNNNHQREEYTIELQAQSSEQSKNHKNMERHMHTCEDAQINHMKILLTKQSITRKPLKVGKREKCNLDKCQN